MQTQDRLVRFSNRPIAFGAAVLVALGLGLLAFVLFTGALRNAQSATTGTQFVIAHEQAPDAQARNLAYTQALSSRFDNQSPDAKDRNLQLSGG